jgi:hypothetical protein
MGVVFTPDAKGSGASPIAVAGGVWMLFGTLTFSGSYPANGDPLDLTKYVPAMGTVRQVIVLGQIRGFTAEYDVVNKKLLLYVATAVTPTTAVHATAAYHALFTASPVPVGLLIK